MSRLYIRGSCFVVGYVIFLYRQHRKNDSKKSLIQLRSQGYLFALVCFLFASRQIPLGKQTTHLKGQWVDVMVMLDVSQSMQVNDMPWSLSRLQFAKNTITTLLQKEPQAKWGIGIFAGEAQGILPLTNDVNLVSTFLAGVDYQNLTKQWTRLDEAIALGTERFDTTSPWGNVLLVFSDGGEEQVDITDKTKEILSDLDISVYLIGIWTEVWGPIIEGVDIFWNPVVKQRQWAPVLSKLDETQLRNAATQTKWTYIHWSPSTVDHLASQIERTPTKLQDESETTQKRTATPFFIIVWLLALFTTIIAPYIPKFTDSLRNQKST